jgi:hypothetical protein
MSLTYEQDKRLLKKLIADYEDKYSKRHPLYKARVDDLKKLEAQHG